MKHTPQEMLAALARLEWRGNQTVFLPPLEPSLYSSIKHLLTLAGVTWDKGKKVHRFTGRPEYAIRQIEEIIRSGKIPKRNPLQFFPTPPDLAGEIAQEAVNQVGYLHDIRPIRLLEPSAGQGALIDAFVRLHPDPSAVEITACEFDPQRHDDLLARGLQVAAHDFLSYQPDEPFDLILMNPPFNLPGDASAWATHLKHAWGMLAERGTLICIVPRTQRLHEHPVWEVFGNQQIEISEHEPGRFLTSGTAFPTATLLVQKEDQSWRERPTHISTTLYSSWHALQAWVGGTNDYDRCWAAMERLYDRHATGRVTEAQLNRELRRVFTAYVRHLRVYGINVCLGERDWAFLLHKWREYFDLDQPNWVMTPEEQAVLEGAREQERRWCTPPAAPPTPPPGAGLPFPPQPPTPSRQELIAALPFRAPAPQPPPLPFPVRATVQPSLFDPL